MRAFVVCSSLLLLAAAPLSAPANPDRFDSMVGTWSCESAQHSVGTMTFVRNDDRTMTAVNHFVAASGMIGERDEIYAVDPVTGVRTLQGADEAHLHRAHKRCVCARDRRQAREQLGSVGIVDLQARYAVDAPLTG